MNTHLRPRGDVRCIETDEVFESVSRASEELGLPYQAIWLSACGKRVTPIEGHTFEYVYDQSYSIRGRRLQ